MTMNRASKGERFRRTLVAQFAASGFVVLLMIGVVSLFYARRQSEEAAVDHAREQTLLVADGLGGLITPEFVRGANSASSVVDSVVRRHILAGTFVRLKIWERNGRIVYSDEPRLVGQHFALDSEDLRIIDDGTVDASLSDLEAPENRYERGYGRLLQVYVRLRDTDGTPLLLETYSRYVTVDSIGLNLWKRFLPALVGGLFGLWLF
jgi:two-component system, NarL family, sensor kinase